MLKKRTSTRRLQPVGLTPAASAEPSGSALAQRGLGISTDDLYWLANEQQKQSLKKIAVYRMLSRINQRGGGGGGDAGDGPPAAPAAIGRKRAGDPAAAEQTDDDAAAAEGLLDGDDVVDGSSSQQRRARRLPPLLADRREYTSDRAFYLGYAPRSVRDGPPNAAAELLGRHACEVLGAQACHACTAESSRLRQQQHGRGASSSSFSAVTVAKATKLKKLFGDRPLRQLQEQLERGEIASDSFVAWRAEKMAAAAAAERRRPADAADDERDGRHSRGDAAAAAFAGPPRDKRTTFFANLADLREKIRFGVIPSAVVPSEDAKLIVVRKIKHADDISATSESFQKIYYAPPLLTVEQQNVQSSFFAGCTAEYSLPPPLPESLLAAQAHAAVDPLPATLPASS